MPDTTELMQRFSELSQEAFQANRSTILAALEGHRITSVVVIYDGYADSGGIEDFEVHGSDEAPDLTIPCVIQSAEWGKTELVASPQPLHEALETMAMQCVAREHGGWENNEGGNGSVTFDVQRSQILVEHTENYIARNEFTHSY
ncbi:hypothetical protein K2X14_14595 [Acetobacter sp. TBRC 12305]|uniref:DUF6878 domain-containing protein n=1 Tax=Acetobacter garciniae TaxID=2817435 RepID=A0A939KNB6_9PROT|nr:DUF6878 family protein [Acetobacter garciniae]MBO1326198.1 hypothetical protein [Acetobacter garciniae]MBX0346065.1 hypothetical protein [Acetobacter garciniae]